VKLPAGEEQQVIDSLMTLLEKGSIILVCGTCLNYYGLTDRLKVGTVSNMYDIMSAMQRADKVITL
jgi:sulfur relay (sulfurtransferase) complex TusBCD TusD component (DsrE family)